MEALIIVGIVVLLLVFITIRSILSARDEKRRYKARLIRDYGLEIDTKDLKIPERFFYLGKYYEKHKDAFYIDDITYNDLELGRVFHKVNYTHSSCGEEYLYYRLRCPDQFENQHALISNEESLIAALSQNEVQRADLQMAMHEIGYTGKYSLYQYLEFLGNLGERSNIHHFWPYLGYLAGVFFLFSSPSIGIACILATMAYMLVTYLREKSDNDPYLISFSFILRMLRGLDNLTASLKTIEEGDELHRLLSETKGKLSTLKKHYFLPKGQSSGDPFSIITDYLKMITHYDLVSFNRMLNDVRKCEDSLDEMYTLMGYTEYLLCVGELRQALPSSVVPVFADKGTGILVQGLYHPLIDGAVPCSFTEKRPMLITGSNASGKSTFLRETALCALLAQSMHVAPASKYQAEYFRIYSSMSLTDDLAGGDSYYMAEIRSLQRILKSLSDTGKPTVLCFVDEVLRGTNTVERIAASMQVLLYFATNHAICIAATHDIELTNLLEGDYSNYHFDEDVKDGDILFSYELKEGRATTRNAIKLLEILGYDASIIEAAQRMSDCFLNEGEWKR